MDDIDRQLIALLRDDARMSVVALAARLRLARATVQNRIARLEADGTIVGYTLRLRPAAQPHRIRAIMSVEVSGPRSDAVRRALRGHAAVASLHTTNGRWDLMAELEVDSLEAFDKALRSIRDIEGISNTETSILLSTEKLS